MNDLNKLARIILVGLGVYVLVRQGIGVIATLPYLFHGEPSMGSFAIVQFVSYAVFVVCIGLAIYVLIWKADFLSAKITGIGETDQVSVWWLPFAFRLAAVCAGIIVLSWSIFAITSTIASYARMMSLSSSRASIPIPFSSRASIPIPWQRLLGWIIQLGLGIYLICGAPHFVRWQVRKTLEHCERWEEPNSISDQEAGV